MMGEPEEKRRYIMVGSRNPAGRFAVEVEEIDGVWWPGREIELDGSGTPTVAHTAYGLLDDLEVSLDLMESDPAFVVEPIAESEFMRLWQLAEDLGVIDPPQRTCLAVFTIGVYLLLFGVIVVALAAGLVWFIFIK